MPSKRGEGQVLIAFALDFGLTRALDQARCGVGENRSVFIRRAIAQELCGRGMAVPPGIEKAPDRVMTKYPPHGRSGRS